MATPLRPDEVPKDLICSICLSVPLEPVIVNQCAHVFCEECITESLHRQECGGQNECCPVCRCECTTDDVMLLEEESPLSYRIWSGIQVKCEHHENGCNWTGSISDYHSHKYVCQRTIEQRQQDNEIIRRLKKENEQLKAKNKYLDIMNQELEARHHHQNWKKVAKELEKLRSMVRNSIERPATNEKGGYDYDRFNVVQLTKLICQNLEDMPDYINPNKIFECVRKIGLDLCRDLPDNPEHFYIDVRMLLGVCLASTWFTEKQLWRLREIAADYGWAQA